MLRALEIETVSYTHLDVYKRQVHGIDVDIVGVEIFFRLQCPCQALFLILRVVFKFAVIPVILKGSGDLVNGFRQVTFRYFGVPFKAAGQCGIGQVGRANIGRREAGFAVKNICLGVEPCRLGVVADLDVSSSTTMVPLLVSISIS